MQNPLKRGFFVISMSPIGLAPVLGCIWFPRSINRLRKPVCAQAPQLVPPRGSKPHRHNDGALVIGQWLATLAPSGAAVG